MIFPPTLFLITNFLKIVRPNLGSKKGGRGGLGTTTRWNKKVEPSLDS